MTWIIDRKDDQKYVVGDGAKPVTVEQYVALMAGKSVDVKGKTWTVEDGPFYVPEEYLVERGGEGSGHFEHEGRPGEVGGSLPSGAGKALPSEAPSRAGIGLDVAPPRSDSEHFEPGSSRMDNKSLTYLSPAQIKVALQEEVERSKRLGLEIYYERDEMLDRTYELSQSALDEAHASWMISEEEFFENWNRSIANAGGDPDPRFVLGMMRQINDAVEQGWMPVPTIPIFFKLQDPDFNGSSQGSYTPNGFTDEGAFIWMFQDPIFQGDKRTSRNRTDEPLIKWLSNHYDEKVEPFSEEAGLVSQYFPSGMAAGVLHEMGHHWDDEYFQMGQAGNAPQGRAFILMNEEGGRDKIKSMISSYAAEKPQETVAEAFLFYHHPRYDELAQERKDLIEYVLFGEES